MHTPWWSRTIPRQTGRSSGRLIFDGGKRALEIFSFRRCIVPTGPASVRKSAKQDNTHIRASVPGFPYRFLLMLLRPRCCIYMFKITGFPREEAPLGYKNLSLRFPE
jgi:hypothetical protein